MAKHFGYLPQVHAILGHPRGRAVPENVRSNPWQPRTAPGRFQSLFDRLDGLPGPLNDVARLRALAGLG
jgi:hypothetical protein